MKNIEINYQSEKSWRGKFVLWILEKLSPLHLWFNPNRKAWGLSSDDMLRFKTGSLGQALGLFYKKEKFEPIPKAERHDVFHVLLGYSTNVIDEAAMQFFLWGNGKASFFTVGTCLMTSILFPNKIIVFITAFQKGRNAVPIGDWNFHLLLSENIDALRNGIFNKTK